MAAWLLDTNIVIYLLAGDARYVERLRALIEQARREAHAFHLTPTVVAEALYVLEDEYFRRLPSEAAELMEGFIQAPEVLCEQKEAVLSGLAHHRDGLDFVDGFLAAKATETDTFLVTNDAEIGKRTAAKLVAW